MMEHMGRLMDGVIEDAGKAVWELDYLNPEERRQVVEAWNQTEAEYPQERCVHELIEEQAERTPEAVAVVYEEQQLSYGELNRRANQLGHYLRELGAGPEARVAICLERSLEMVIAVLGTLKAGAAYVPVEFDLPSERLKHIFIDAHPTIVLTQIHLLPALPEFTAQLCLDDWNRLDGMKQSKPDTAAELKNAAYVIYTSGSTGLPKGVIVQHDALLNYLSWVKQSLLASIDYLPAITNLGFDASLKQILGPLLAGRTVHVLGDSFKSPIEILRHLSLRRRAALNCVPSLWQQIVEEIDKDSRNIPTSLAQLWLGGESCTPELIKKSLQLLPDLKISNLYGPTEATANAVFAERIPSEQVYIGKPIANAKVFVVDANLQPTPVGVTGELCIA